MEASNVLYTQNTLEFDFPVPLIAFSEAIRSSTLNIIQSISIDVQRQFYQANGGKFYSPSQWIEMWDIIAEMQGLRKLRIKFRPPTIGFRDWVGMDVLQPLWKVTGPLEVFEVEVSSKSWLDDVKDDEEGSQAPFKLSIRD